MEPVGGSGGAGDGPPPGPLPTAPADGSVAAAKSAARRLARATRRHLVAGRRLEQDDRSLARHVLALVATRPGGPHHRVAAYVAYGVEPPTVALVAALAGAGHEVVLPRLLGDRSLGWVDLRGEDLGPDALVGASLVVAPGLAVDRARTRLGQGGGSYDRALAHLEGPAGRRADVLVVTLLHDGELRRGGDLLPCTPLDLPVDGVVTADGGFVDLR